MSELGGWWFGNGPIRWVQDLFGPGHPLPFRVLSLLGDTWGVVLVVGLGLWLFGRRTMHALVGIVAAGAAVKLLLMELVYQTRPSGPGIVVYEHLEMSSFPSGHVFAAVGPWGLLYALGCVRLWVPAGVAVAVGLGRLYLGTHYLGDVLGGLAFGAALVWSFHRAWPRLRAWLDRRGPVFPFAVGAGAIAGTLAAWALTGEAHPRRYEIYGMAAAAAIALPLESRYLHYEPAAASRSARALIAVTGLAGIAACLLWDRRAGEDALFLGAVTAGLATLWALLAVPAALRSLGFGARRHDLRPGPRCAVLAVHPAEPRAPPDVS